MLRLLFLFLLLLAFSCGNDIDDINRLVKNKIDLSIEKAVDVSLIFSDSAVVKIKVTGPTMLTYKDKMSPRKEFPDGLMVEFFNGRNVGSRLTANYAVQYENKKEIVLRDSVVWVSGKPEKLETEELIWNEKTKKLKTNRFVKITTPTDVVYGYGFEAEQDFSKWKILAPQGDLNVKNLNN